ncbi:MAG: DUF4845 domain-containing protein [Rudaea sp.]
MRSLKRQTGLTLISMVIVMAVLGFFAYAAMKLIPAYTEYFGVVKSMKAVADKPNAAEMTLENIRRELDLNYSVQYVDEATVPPGGVKLETANGARRLHITYDKVMPFLYNISLMAHFDHSEDLMRSGTGY